MGSLTLAGPGTLRGRIRVPGDKSISHRALLLAALAEGTSTLRGLAGGDDVARTRAAVAAMGATAEGERVSGGTGRLGEPTHVIDVGNSGTSMRLLAGWCAARPWLTVLDGDASLSRRPMDRVAEPLRAMGAHVDGRQGGRYAPLVVRGGDLVGIEHVLRVPSAQVKGAVLLAGLGADGQTVVHEPVPTRAHTEELLARAGADVTVDAGSVRVRRSRLRPFHLAVPGDPSAAALWVVAACITSGSDVTVEGVYVGPARAGYLEVLARMGAEVEVTMVDERTADLRARSSQLVGTEVAGAEVPGLIDEIPVLAVAAARAAGTTTFRDAAELRVKESDRVATTVEMLSGLGAEVEALPDGLVIHGSGGRPLRPAVVDAHLDHRVALAAAVAALAATGATTIEGWEAVATSYPSFEEDLARCGS
ncbi:MAG: 3-phosphoshikimate 1-carboxyvinyltransferase [Acidimicrobiales bacterium]